VIVPSPTGLESIVDALGRFGAVTTSVVLRAEKPKTVGRKLMARV
jgi:Lrp/AsnC family leucine-responsive transcriptional regulator